MTSLCSEHTQLKMALEQKLKDSRKCIDKLKEWGKDAGDCLVCVKQGMETCDDLRSKVYNVVNYMKVRSIYFTGSFSVDYLQGTWI